MGTFGTAIFSEDFACDIRDEFKELIGEGLTPEQATNDLVSSNADSLNDPDEATVFWLALAAIQWKTGRLLDSVKEKAIGIIEDGSDLERWKLEGDKKVVAEREKQLQRLKENILSPQPSPKKIGKAFKHFTPFEVGDVVAYSHSSGNFALMRVIGLYTDNGGCRPTCELLDYFQSSIPSDITILENLPFYIFSHKTENWPHQTSMMTIMVATPKDDPKEKVKVIAKGVKGQQQDNGPREAFLWRDFDERLTEILGNKKSRR
jgi:hypothetical protein